MTNENIGMISNKAEYMESRQDDIKKEMKKLSTKVDDRVGEVMDRDEISSAIQSEIVGSLGPVFKDLIHENQDKIISLIKEQMNVKAIIGEEPEWKSYQEWVEKVNDEITKLPKELSDNNHEFENSLREINEAIQAQEDKINQNCLKEIQELNNLFESFKAQTKEEK